MHRHARRFQRLLQFAQGQLSGADHHVIDRQQDRFFLHNEVQPFVVDAVIGDLTDHVHLLLAQTLPVNPSRRFAEFAAELALAALQQIHFARTRIGHGFLQTPGAAVSQVDAPLVGEDFEILRAAFVAVAVYEKLRHIEADAARPDERNAFSNGHLAFQHIDVAHHFLVVDALNFRGAGRDARREDHLVVLAFDQIGGVDAGIQVQVYARQFDTGSVVAERLVEFFFARNLLGQIELPPDLGGRIVQIDVVTPLGGDGGGTESGGTGTYYGDALRFRCGAVAADRLVAGQRIDQTARNFSRKGVVQAGLVAGDADIDLLAPSLAGLVHELRIGQEGPRHADHIGVSVGQDLLPDLGRIDAVDRDERDVHLAHQAFGHPAEAPARHHRRDGRDPGLVPADAGIDERGSRRFDLLRQIDHFGPGTAALHQIEHAEAVDDDELRSHGRARLADDLQRQADAVLETAPVGIGALVGARRDELIEQIPLAAHDLDAVIARVLRELGAAHEIALGAPDAGAGQFPRFKFGNGRLDGRRCHTERMVAVAPRV